MTLAKPASIEIALYNHHILPGPDDRPIWQGTLDQFRADNPSLSDTEIARIVADLEDGRAGHTHHMGGGAAAAFTIVRAGAFARRAA